MLDCVSTWRAHRIDKRAVTAMEYALIAAFIALAIVGAVRTLGTSLIAPFTTVSAALVGG
jgi:pilus assembly protein Flp/PilA